MGVSAAVKPERSAFFGVAGMATAAWRYRTFILSSIVRDYRARFARSKLGLLWLVVHPLVNAAIFALVLSEMMAAKLPGMAGDKLSYAVYVMSGALGWSLFAELVGRCTGIFVENGDMLKRLQFPRISLPLIVAGSALVNALLLYAAIILIAALLGRPPGLATLWIPVVMLVPLALGLGLGLLLGVFNVFVRDISQVVPVVLQVGFWTAPIVYVPSILPATIAPLVERNPMTPVVQAFQSAMLYDLRPDWTSLAGVTIAAVVLLAVSLFMFRRASPELVDAL